MVNDKKNEIVALFVVILVSIIGLFLMYWFYLTISPVQLKTEETKSSLQIKNDVLDKITNQNSSASLLLQDSDFGRENPFNSVK